MLALYTYVRSKVCGAKKKRSLTHMILSHTHQQRDIIIIITITIVVVDTSYDIPRV